ncbi:TPA: potassium/proton antiporter [Neisseria gonorrhoeae]
MNSLFLLGGALLFLSVVSTTLSARLGMPLLLVFLAVGMLAGEEGVGGIAFNNVVTQLSSFRIALKPASVLASWGVFATVLPLGLFATFYLGLDWKFGVLMAAIVGSTDAGAVFSLLRNSGVRLNERVQATLEIESGANDPMAVFLVTALITMIMQPAESGAAAFVRMLALQIGFGLLTGWAGGKILAKLVRRLNLAEGLYALMIVSGGLLVFAFTNTIGGSGFLAVYLAGIIVGNQRNRATEHVLRVMDGLAWLAQATLFVMLGLLVSPAGVLDRAAEALAIAAFLMLVARPLAVFGGLWKFNYSLREKAYISWLGLRGAVPISLAMMPLVMGVPNSHLLFDVAFAVVVLSLLIQGTTIPVMARLLKVAMPNKPEPKDTHDIWLAEKEIVRMSAFKVVAESEAEGHHPDTVEPISDSFDARCFALIRNGSRIEMQSDTVLQAEDLAWYILPDGKVDKMAKYFTETGIGVRENFDFFGEFVVSPAARSGDLALAYGLKLEAGEEGLSLAELFDKRSDSQEPVEGDRIDIGGFMLTAKEVDGGGNIGSMGLKVPR